MYHCVYRITHILDWRIYIGKHSGKIPPKEDIGNPGGYFSSSKDIDFMADQKKNPQDYKYDIIKTFKTSLSAINYEIYLHNKYNVGINPRFYNLAKQTSSGFDTTGRKGTIIESKIKSMIQPNLKINDPDKYKEINLKRSLSLTGTKNPNARLVSQVNIQTGKVIKVWSFIKEAADFLKISPSSISHASNPKHKNKTAGGYGWITSLENPLKVRKKYKTTNKNKAKNHPASKPILQINLENNTIIKEWSCAAEASRSLNIDVTTIRRVANINTNNKSAGGFGWKGCK